MTDWLAPLLRDDARPLGPEASAGRFEGLYGFVYDRAIRSAPLRRLAPLAYGDVGPLSDLDGFMRRVAAEVDGVLLDVPTGGGTLLPLLERAGFGGRVIASDLGEAMLRRVAPGGLDVAVLRADALDLPLRDASVDGAVSLNGLHVMPSPHRFVAELARVIRPGGRLFLITLVSGGNHRGDAVILGGRLSGILPGPPPPTAALLRLLEGAGFTDVEDLGGEALVGLAARRRGR